MNRGGAREHAKSDRHRCNGLTNVGIRGRMATAASWRRAVAGIAGHHSAPTAALERRRVRAPVFAVPNLIHWSLVSRRRILSSMSVREEFLGACGLHPRHRCHHCATAARRDVESTPRIRAPSSVSQRGQRLLQIFASTAWSAVSTSSVCIDPIVDGPAQRSVPRGVARRARAGRRCAASRLSEKDTANTRLRRLRRRRLPSMGEHILAADLRRPAALIDRPGSSWLTRCSGCWRVVELTDDGVTRLSGVDVPEVGRRARVLRAASVAPSFRSTHRRAGAGFRRPKPATWGRRCGKQGHPRRANPR